MGDSTVEEIALLHVAATNTTHTIRNRCTGARSLYRTFDSEFVHMRWSAHESCIGDYGRFNPFTLPKPPPDAIVWQISALHKIGASSSLHFAGIIDDIRLMHRFVSSTGLPHVLLINGANLFVPNASRINSELLAMQEAVPSIVGNVPRLDAFRATLRWLNSSKSSLIRAGHLGCRGQARHLSCLQYRPPDELRPLRWADIVAKPSLVLPPAYVTLAAVLSATSESSELSLRAVALTVPRRIGLTQQVAKVKATLQIASDGGIEKVLDLANRALGAEEQKGDRSPGWSWKGLSLAGRASYILNRLGIDETTLRPWI